MSTTYLAALVVGGSIAAAVVLLGFIAVSAMALQWLVLRATERLARAGRLDEHGVRMLTHLADHLDGIVRLVLDAVRSRTSLRR